jgi:hypothetical protein
MKRIYKLSSSYEQNEIESMLEKAPVEILQEIGNSGKDPLDGVYIADELGMHRISELIGSVLDESRYSIEDITESVVFGKHSEESETHKAIFEEYLDKHLTIDAVLDKINKYGMASLTKRDFKALEE